MRFTLLIGALATLLLTALSGDAWAQKSARFAPVDPEVFGFDIPNGRIRPGEDRCVLAREEDGIAVVAKIYVEVGDYLILMLPDGRLIARHQAQTQGTTRPFVPDTKDTLSATLVANDYPGFRVRKTRNFLFVYNTTEIFAEATANIMESMMPGVINYVEQQGIKTTRPEVPLIVVMFSDVKEYQRLTGAPPGAVAFYSILNNRVMMYEKSGLELVRPDLATQEAVSTIAHEGTHQILANIGVQQRLSFWPMWVSEGIAEFCSPTTIEGRFRWNGVAQVNNMRMYELEVYLVRKGLKPDGESVAATIEAARLTSTGYAYAWSLVHFLATTQKQKFNEYMRELSKLGPLEGDLKEPGAIKILVNRTLFEQQFGNDFIEIERKLIKHLKDLPYKRPVGG